jgi:uncharacterized membrane protein
MTWSEFALAFLVFFLSHSVPVRPPVRPILVGALGPRGFTLAYSALSVGVLTWLIVAAGRAPFVLLWSWAPWQNHMALVLMLAACLLLTVSIGRPNPFSFGGSHNHLFDPARPGVIRLTRHPLLAVLALWSAGHLLANGDLAHVILFGIFGAFSLLGTRLVDRRRKREMGEAWEGMLSISRNVPVSQAVRPAGPTLWRLCLGVGLFVGLIMLHPFVIGVDPLP